MQQTATRGSLLAVFLTVFIDLLGFGMVLPLLPVYADEFTLDETGLVIGLLASSFSVMQFLFAPVWGRLSDRIGRRPVLMIGLTGSVVFYAIFGVATAMRSLTLMFLSRVGAGIAGATIPTAQAYIADTTTRENRAKGMALIGAAFGLGFTFGPLLAAAALISADQHGLSPWPGFVASGLSAIALIFAFFKLPESRQPSADSHSHKLLDVQALRAALAIPTIVPLLLTSFVSILSFANFEGILAFLLAKEAGDAPGQGGFGYEITDVVLFFALLGFIHAMAQGLVRRLVSRTSEGNLATAGALISAAGFLVLVLATRQTSIGLLVTGMLVTAIGFAFMPPTIQALISRRSDPERQGSILGLGQSLGALARILGHGICFPLFYLDPTLPFWTGTGVMLLALLLVVMNAHRGADFAEASSDAPEPHSAGASAEPAEQT